MNRMKQKYQQEVVPALIKQLGCKNVFQVPKILKIVINMGIADPQDPKLRQKVAESVVEQFKLIAGQLPQITKAKKSIAGFKLRAGDPLGVMVTLRGDSMWEFFDKLVSVTLPRVKDFRGISLKAFDGEGNYSLGLEEQIVFPEIDYDKIDKIRSLQVNIVTSKTTKEASRSMLEMLGMPFEKPELEQKM